MMDIAIKNQFGEINLTNSLVIDSLLESMNSIDFSATKDIHLDLTGCITDYPQTPKLIDFFLILLSSKKGDKSLTVTYTGLGTNITHVLFDLILEGDYFEISKEVIKSGLNWKEIIDSKLKSDSIILTIECPLDKAKYEYGK